MTSEATGTAIAAVIGAVGVVVLLRRVVRRSRTQIHRVVVPTRGGR